MQAYAVDAPLCPNGAPHQPKYDHLTAMHAALADAAPSILASDVRQNGLDRQVTNESNDSLERSESLASLKMRV